MAGLAHLLRKAPEAKEIAISEAQERLNNIFPEIQIQKETVVQCWLRRKSALSADFIAMTSGMPCFSR